VTEYEMKRMARLQAQYLAEAMKQDDELLDLVFPPRFMGIEEAAQFTGIPKNSLYTKVNEIPHVKMCGRLLFTDRGLTRWLKRKPSVAVELGIKKVI